MFCGIFLPKKWLNLKNNSYLWRRLTLFLWRGVPTSSHINIKAIFFTFLWSQILELVTQYLYGYVTSVTNMGRKRVIHQNLVPMSPTSWHININATTFTFFVIPDLMAFSLFPRKLTFIGFSNLISPQLGYISH